MFKGLGTSEWRTTSVTLGAIGEVECGKSLVSKKASNFGNTAEVACLWFNGLTGMAGAFLVLSKLSTIGLGLSTGVSTFDSAHDVLRCISPL